MEHVLRQCLIALRLAERVGLDEDERARRLLHGAAGQRRLPLRCSRAGEVVRRRHRARSRRSTTTNRAARAAPRRRCAWSARAIRRCTGSGSASSSRSPGRSDVERHDRGARRARADARPSSSASPTPCSDARRHVVRALGRPRLAGRLQGRRDPDRVAARAARGVRRGRASDGRRRRGDSRSPRARRLRSSTRCSSTLLRARRARSSAGSTGAHTWDAVIAAEPALGVRSAGDGVRRRAARDRPTSST